MLRSTSSVSAIARLTTRSTSGTLPLARPLGTTRRSSAGTEAMRCSAAMTPMATANSLVHHSSHPLLRTLTVYSEWGGHWRGDNATDETVICDLSYETRRPLEQLCAFGYTVAGSETNTYFGSDLIHRLFHMPAFGENYVEHFAENYAGALELARTNATFATHDSDILQYFALDVYAYDITIPGVGCPGTEGATTSTTSGTPAAATPTPTPTVADAASATSDVPAVSGSNFVFNFSELM